jgi:uncharacterized MAPEG superfamily protein
MHTDLLVLLAIGLLSFVLQMLPSSTRVAQPGGMAWGIGNRDEPPKLEGWTGRAKRAHSNLMENLPHYLIVVVALQFTQRSSATTAMLSLAFLGARVAHAIVYVAGITYVRTLAFYVGLAAEIGLATQLFAT